MSSERDTTYSFVANFCEQVTAEGPMATCSSFFLQVLAARPAFKHSTTRDSRLNEGFQLYG
jgi:hypothetical protein